MERSASIIKSMKVAIVHDYIKEYGGAERVLEALHEMFPDAPVYTSLYLPEYLGPHQNRFKDWDIKTSWLQNVPFKEKLISPFRLLAPFAFKSFNFFEFDVVIVSATGAYASNSIMCHPERSEGSDKKKGPIHICYCHTPPRYLYGYMTAREWKKNILLRIFGELANHILRLVDYKSAQNVDVFIANSQEVKARIKKFYRKDAVVVYPPVDTGAEIGHASSHKEKDYYLAGGRLARAKGIEVIIDAFRKNKKELKIFGKGFAGYENELQVESANIEMLGEVTDKEKLELMKNAKAFVFASYDEDFGITPVEAMSVGTPVIAYKSGGVQETVVDGKTGIFYNSNDSEHLDEAIKKFEKLTFDPQDCIKQAAKFSKERFIKEIMSIVKQNVKK